MIKFLVFADFHYKKGMYATRVEHLNKIMQAANENNVDFVVHLGDLCNDYLRSPELVNAYLSNQFSLDVFGIIGNHELEAEGNSLEYVSKLLSNKDLHFADSEDGYYFYDVNNYRLIGLDTNYSFNPNENKWEHNKTRSHGAPVGNRKENSLSPKQIQWLEQILSDANKQNLKAVIFSHVGLCPWWEAVPDSREAREVISKYKSTIALMLSGHIHSDDFKVWEDIPYFNVNASINGCWREEEYPHYSNEHTFIYDHYDENGSLVFSENRPLNSLLQGKNTWFFDSPLYAIVTLDDDFGIDIEGTKTNWLHNIAPTKPYTNCKAEISSVKHK